MNSLKSALARDQYYFIYVWKSRAAIRCKYLCSSWQVFFLDLHPSVLVVLLWGLLDEMFCYFCALRYCVSGGRSAPTPDL